MTTFIPTTRRSTASKAIRKAAQLLPLLAIGAVAMAAEPGRPAATTQRQQQTRTVVDPAVQPAGGVCRQCGPGGCQPGHAHRHHRDCRDGACVPYCPVRPSTFGFYGTQWRRWPGQGVTPVSHNEAATPVKPPRSAVPGADEESIGPKPSELPEPDFPRGDSPAADRSPLAPEPDQTAPEPAAPAATTETTPEATAREDLEGAPRTTEPGGLPRGEEKPVQPATPPAKPRPEDDNLFDDSAARKVRRKIPAAAANQSTPRAVAARVQPAAHHDEQTTKPTAGRAAAPQSVPRVPFDPRQEAARMRQTR
jgi:hypothetical protein